MKITFLIALLLFSVPALTQGVTPKEQDGFFGFFASDSMILDFQFDSIRRQYDGSFAVQKGGRWGIVDAFGKQILSCRYDKVHLYQLRLYYAKFEGMTGLVDTNGNVFLEFLYDEIDHIRMDTQILVKYQGKWSWCKNGQLLDNTEDILFYFPEFAASLPGCFHGFADPVGHKICARNKLREYMAEHVKYPYAARLKGIEGQVVVGFFITVEGKIEKPVIMNGIGKSCDEEVLRVLLEMPIWIPGTVDGSPVKTLQIFPVDFQLTD